MCLMIVKVKFWTLRVKQVQEEEGSNELHSSDDKTSQEIQDAGRLFKI